jgi:hypothetical protein
MNKLSTVIGLAAAAMLAGVSSQAQLVTNVTVNASGGTTTTVAAQTFFDSTYKYFTDFNTNADMAWGNETLEVATGYKQVTGSGATSTLDVQYDFGRWNVGADFQFFGVGSAINQVEGQVGYAVIQHADLKVDLDLRGGYDTATKTGVVEPTAMLKKKLTPNTFAETGVSLPIEFKGKLNTNPSFFVEMGFTYWPGEKSGQ